MIYFILPAFLISALLLSGAIYIGKEYRRLLRIEHEYYQHLNRVGAITLNDFQILCGHTDKYKDSERLICTALGTSSEAGEVAGKVDKWIRKNHNNKPDPDFSREIALETFDVCWFAVRLMHSLGYSFSDVAQMGLAKLRSRDQRNVIATLDGGDHR